MSRDLHETKKFKADKKRIKGSGSFDWLKMRAVVKELMNDRPLSETLSDHPLKGDYAGANECHVAPDWLLIYDKVGDVKTGRLNLIRTGSHSELF